MSNKARRYNLSKFREAQNAEGAIEIETDDGSVFKLDSPKLWPDEYLQAVRTGGVLELAKAVMGEEQYAAFVAAGGNALTLDAIIQDAAGASAGESSASSGS